MSGEAGAPGTAGDGFRVPKAEPKHRAPPVPPRFQRLYVPAAMAATVLTLAALIAITAPAVAPDGRAAGNGATVSTAVRTVRTVHVPLTILPAPVPTIGASGAWDPETDAPIALNRPVPSQNFAGATGTASAPQALSGDPVPLTGTPGSTTTATTSATTRSTAQTTTAPPAGTTAAATTTSSATEEPTVTPEPTADPTPTDIGDVIDEVLGTEVGAP